MQVKPKRHDDPGAVKENRRDRCELCGKPAHGDPHHIITKGAGGPDIKENLIQLCWDCHYGQIPTGKITRKTLFTIVARREGIPIEETISRVEKMLGRGIKP